MWRRIQKFLATFIPSLIFLLFLVVVVCRLNQWDSTVAITLIPFWAWAAVGAVACLLCWIICRGVPSIVVFTIWVATAIAISEESHGLFRELINTIDPLSPPPEEERIRVVNLNANDGEEALKIVKSLEPDILILQEAPGREVLATLQEELFGMEGDLLVGGNHAILARGEFIDTIAQPKSSVIHARLRWDEEFLIDITSLQLAPCLPRPSLWDPETWETLSWIRMQNRRQLRTFLGENQITRPNTGRIVSGGFETPPGDDVFHPLVSNGLRDAFKVSGEGWGNTYPVDYSVLRLDQIWISDNLQPFVTTTSMPPGSAHRAVISDLWIIREEE